MGRRKEGRHIKDSTNLAVIDILKNYRGEDVTIEELMILTKLGRHGLLGVLRGMREGDRWVLRYNQSDDEYPTLLAVSLLVDRSEVMRDKVYNPACWPVPKSLQTHAG